MDEKVFIDLLNHDEVRDYFDGLFQAQTNSIRQAISETQNEELIQESRKNEELNRELSERKSELEEKNKKIKELEDCKERLQSDLRIKDNNIKSLQKEICELNTKNHIITEENEKAKNIINIEYKGAKEKWERLKQRYATMETVVEAYSHLSSETLARTKNIMGNGKIYDFISLSREWKNVEGLWNYIKRRIIEEDTVDIKALISIFECLFEFNQGCTGTVRLELIKTNPGTKYDSDEHSIIGIKTDGIIREVLLPGICEKSSGKVIQKALVKV